MAIKTSKGDGKARKKCLAALYRRLQRLEKTQGENKMTTKVSLTKKEREQVKYALENRIEYLVYSLHMPPMSDSVQVSIMALDSLGYGDTAQGYRAQLKEWQDMYDNDNYPDYGE